jgi:hypothetical protein
MLWSCCVIVLWLGLILSVAMSFIFFESQWAHYQFSQLSDDEKETRFQCKIYPYYVCPTTEAIQQHAKRYQKEIYLSETPVRTMARELQPLNYFVEAQLLRYDGQSSNVIDESFKLFHGYQIGIGYKGLTMLNSGGPKVLMIRFSGDFSGIYPNYPHINYVFGGHAKVIQSTLLHALMLRLPIPMVSFRFPTEDLSLLNFGQTDDLTCISIFMQRMTQEWFPGYKFIIYGECIGAMRFHRWYQTLISEEKQEDDDVKTRQEGEGMTGSEHQESPWRSREVRESIAGIILESPVLDMKYHTLFANSPAWCQSPFLGFFKFVLPNFLELEDQHRYQSLFTHHYSSAQPQKPAPGVDVLLFSMKGDHEMCTETDLEQLAQFYRQTNVENRVQMIYSKEDTKCHGQAFLTRTLSFKIHQFVQTICARTVVDLPNPNPDLPHITPLTHK